MPPDTHSSLLRVTQQRELKDATQNLNRPFSISDRSLEGVLHLVTQTRSEAVGLKFVWVCVQIGQLNCKACVCVEGEHQARGKRHLLRCYQCGREDYSCLKACTVSLGGLFNPAAWLWTSVNTVNAIGCCFVCTRGHFSFCFSVFCSFFSQVSSATQSISSCSAF